MIGDKKPVRITQGGGDWQVLQQDINGTAELKASGTWSTILRRERPEVRVRICREEGFEAIRSDLNWAPAQVRVDRRVRGEGAGKSGTWSITIRGLPAGGPYRVDTSVGNAGDAIEWRRQGEGLHFLCVGDVWLIAGQSNAEGYGRDPVDDPPEIGVQHFGGTGWALATHGANHSPWLAFAKRLKRELGYPIGLIPTAVGGSPISRWVPGRGGDLFAEMVRRVKAAGPEIRGCVWYQGESDTGPKDVPRYAARFASFAKGLRRVSRQPALPLITVQLNRVLGQHENAGGWEPIREIQRQLAHQLESVFVIPIFEAGLCDGIHISAQGNLLVAQRAATTALGAVYARDIPFRHPECCRVRRVSGRALDLYFANVHGRMDYECALENGFPFAVRDAKGDVSVSGYTWRRKDVMRIRLSRPLSGLVSVTGAPGPCPPQIVPRDISGYRGMLGFTLAVD